MPAAAGLTLGGRRSCVRSLGAAQATLDLPKFKYLACRKYHLWHANLKQQMQPCSIIPPGQKATHAPLQHAWPLHRAAVLRRVGNLPDLQEDSLPDQVCHAIQLPIQHPKTSTFCSAFSIRVFIDFGNPKTRKQVVFITHQHCRPEPCCTSAPCRLRHTRPRVWVRQRHCHPAARSRRPPARPPSSAAAR